jgi:hypothetical protein
MLRNGIWLVCRDGLSDRSRRIRYANQLPFQIEMRIVRLKQDRVSRGRRKSQCGKLLILLVGVAGSEPATPRRRRRRAPTSSKTYQAQIAYRRNHAEC